MDARLADHQLSNAQRFYRTWVEPYLRDPALWAVLFAIAGHVVMALVPVLLAAWRTSEPFWFVVLAILVGLSGKAVHFEVVYQGRPGPLSVVTALIWLGSFGLTWVALETGFL